ncbi:Aspartate/ornithine carbamoyltransferase,carbamoyl-P binding domain protein [Clostridium bornimense]|uniref:Aspartate/ornithine carbamoyltransferase,carbamoyl-P binding domain protein n=1 Tax=Clostridium bornimense TaxID=1216932 RepID=W6SI69_9CLOT|nr:peptide transporter [Clostridium bornimense]CDM69375.1 Aspartate/ornithine carbamoyltransferase,carbamoyl-P binding domain protein [Clostridium bornimense]
MKNLIRLTDYSKEEIEEIFYIADNLKKGNYKKVLDNKTVVMFFPSTSIRTRVTFEKGISMLGGQVVLFPSDTLDKKEEIQDVIGYLNNWADLVIVRHNDITLIEEIARHSKVPIINAMSSINHPCEMLADIYSLSKIRKDILKDKYLFVGHKGNIALAWKEVKDVLGISLEQCCPNGYEIEGINFYQNINEAVVGKDIILTDSLKKEYLKDFKDYKVTKTIMDKANKGAILNPCPPFYRGEEVDGDVINSEYFVGYEFKKYLLEVQQAIILFCIGKGNYI